MTMVIEKKHKIENNLQKRPRKMRKTRRERKIKETETKEGECRTDKQKKERQTIQRERNKGRQAVVDDGKQRRE